MERDGCRSATRRAAARSRHSRVRLALRLALVALGVARRALILPSLRSFRTHRRASLRLRNRQPIPPARPAESERVFWHPIESIELVWSAPRPTHDHALVLRLTGDGYARSASVATSALPDPRFSWVCGIDPDLTAFEDDIGYDDQTKARARHRAKLALSRLTIASWKDGFLEGPLDMKTVRGPTIDGTILVRCPDEGGVLARAASPAAEPTAAAPAREPAMKSRRPTPALEERSPRRRRSSC